MYGFDELVLNLFGFESCCQFDIFRGRCLLVCPFEHLNLLWFKFELKWTVNFLDIDCVIHMLFFSNMLSSVCVCVCVFVCKCDSVLVLLIFIKIKMEDFRIHRYFFKYVFRVVALLIYVAYLIIIWFYLLVCNCFSVTLVVSYDIFFNWIIFRMMCWYISGESSYLERQVRAIKMWLVNFNYSRI